MPAPQSQFKSQMLHFNPAPCYWSGKGSERWLKCSWPSRLFGWPRWSSWLSVIWGVNQQTEAHCVCVLACLSLFHLLTLIFEYTSKSSNKKKLCVFMLQTLVTWSVRYKLLTIVNPTNLLITSHCCHCTNGCGVGRQVKTLEIYWVWNKKMYVTENAPTASVL